MGAPLLGDGMAQRAIENPSLELMMRQSFPELGMALRGRIERILDRFRTTVTEVLPSADELTLNELRDGLPDALHDLVVALETTGMSMRQSLLSESRSHGVCRYHQSFNLSELLVEYSILRSIMIEEISKQMDRPMTLEEISAINVGLDAASRRAVESFVKHQQQEALASTEAMSKYLSFISHDLRGSLNGILLTVEVLRREFGVTVKGRSWVDDLETMRRSIMDTVAGMERFLHAERFRRGKVDVRPAGIKLEQVIPEMVLQFAEPAKKKGIEIVADTSDCPTVVSDRELVQLILQNLVGNAVKYSKEGKVEIVARRKDIGGVRISVSDSGPGISPEQMGKIFQPYIRGANHGEAGIGLGLSIAREATQLLKARLWAENKAGGGAIFHLELPSNP
jgi:signal transduction histidine kinase